MTIRLFLLVLCALPLGCNRPEPVDDDDASVDDDDSQVTDDDDATADDDDSGDDDDATGPSGGLVTCQSSVPSVTSSWGQPSTVTFTATGTWTDGIAQDVTEDAVWSLLGGPGGSVVAGAFTTAEFGAGVATLQVEWEGVTGTCGVATYLEATLDLTADPAIGAAVAGATVSSSDACAPYVLYPLDGALIPPDFFSPEVQWIPATGNDVFVITLTTTYITLTAITQDPSWTPTGEEWWGIANPVAGANIAMTVAGGDWDESTGALVGGLCQSTWPLQLWTASWGGEGTIFYWTPGSQGLWEIDIGTETATPWMDYSVVGACVGCHSINLANPTLLAVTQGGGGYGASVVTQDLDPTAPLVGPGPRQASFSALNPTGTRLVRAYQGQLYLDDLVADVELSTVPTTGWATHPNISPDGQWLIYSSCAGSINDQDWNAFGCDLRVIELLAGDAFGVDMSLVMAPPGQNYYYPTFSPDSQWVAFNRSSAGGEVYDEPTAELMLVPAAGGVPTALAMANGLPNMTNSWPRWGPIVGDVGWIAFGSRRPYALQTSGNAQVWVAGVDLTQVAAGVDGSYAPVWLPGQDTATGNHTPAFVQRPTQD